MEEKRISFDDLFMGIVELLEKRTTCVRKSVGAILVKNNIMLSTGYNGSPSKLEHCFKLGCLREKLKIPSGQRIEICRAVHAEQNALIQCALKQTDTSDSVLYCSYSPCVTCAKLLIQARIKKIVFRDIYDDELAFKILREANIELIKYSKG